MTAVLVAGIGARTALGGAAAGAAAVRAGVSAVAEHPYMIDGTGQKVRVARAPYVEDGLPLADRLAALALPAAREAARPLAGRGPAVSLLLALPPPRPGRPDDLEARLTAALTDGLPEAGRLASVRTFATGHAAGLAALEEGWKAVASGRAEAVLVGGADSWIEPDTLDWLDETEQLHSERWTWGFAPGEGAGFCLLVSESTARSLGVAARTAVVAAATAREKNLIRTDAVCVGEGLTAAVRGATAGLAPSARIDEAVCDLNGEPYRADEIGFMIARTSERFADPAGFRTPAQSWGDVGAAGGPLFVSLVEAALGKGYARGPRALLWASSDGGQRAAALLEAVAP